MSDEAPEQEQKTEDPSERKLREAQEKGNVVKSQEVNTWFILSGSALVFAMMAGPTSQSLVSSLRVLLENAEKFEVGSQALQAFWGSLAGSILLVALLPSIVLAVFGVAANLVQHRPLLSLEPLKPKFSKINPLEGAKRLFGVEALVNFAKGLVKLAVVSAVLWFVLAPQVDSLENLIRLEPGMIVRDFMDLSLKIFGAVLSVVTIIAIADYLYQRNRWWNRLKMTVQETRDEYKQQEGDPKVKGRIRQVRMERSRKRMMAAVPKATVVITNPTHFAVALKYDRDMAAPQCVAKGADAIAFRIRELAKANDVPIVENPPLARALYAAVDIDQTIPGEHFKAVAEVIGFVMRLKRSGGWKASG
ncbi:MAG: flagellar biosynthesis protein FlhB [Devosia sp.]|uniref:flagellar biosynthesis protein FlhB n=1 Tax=Devosia sp. TaxID=1871048 RepID=UPI001AD51AC4|nr:flagellar biosynthesis protein FlhB [Devosia sp.]MBN9316061.1 flagellar biosynthesis protein FlhB [Devosia sp.]